MNLNGPPCIFFAFSCLPEGQTQAYAVIFLNLKNRVLSFICSVNTINNSNTTDFVSSTRVLRQSAVAAFSGIFLPSERLEAKITKKIPITLSEVTHDMQYVILGDIYLYRYQLIFILYVV